MYRLRSHLHYCYSGGRAIFLDADNGRYSCLAGVGEAAFLAFRNGAASSDEMDWLTANGILVEDNEPHGLELGRRDIRSPSAQIEVRSKPKVADIWSAARERVVAHASLRLRGFSWAYCSIIAAKRGRGGEDRSDSTQVAIDVAAAFHATDLILGKTDRCLPRSLGFLRICFKRGYFPSLVIGVRTNPFTAHAWVQSGDLVLNDGIDQVRVFTPIMVL